ncbi:MAG: hypothetical protein ABII94_01395 [Patescibacteria group bacterium]|nr:hypothetical protein [Patescibacteria group bacterium]MBU1160271.1 hypothetical protein [Patescibacteria group bacterium]MBU1778397.1 hypothetical protein [Patescibacteria group bacterium]MBU1987331.1 hypothetical protein [Patescibacteria group bacterium]
MKYKKTLKISIFLIILMSIIVPVVQAETLQNAFGNEALNETAKGAGYNTGVTSPASIISAVIKIALSLLGVVFLLLMLYGGYLWMTARGNEQEVEKAKNIITSAVIGMLIVIGSYAITYFIFKKI